MAQQILPAGKLEGRENVESALRWLTGFHRHSLAAYVLRNDSGLSLLGANRAFYRLFGCSEAEMRSRYGNQLGALLAAEALEAFESVTQVTKDKNTPQSVTQRIRRKHDEIWIRTEIAREDESLLYCTSFEITEYERERQRGREHEASARLAFEQAGLDYFDYDLESGAARIYAIHAVLPESLISVGEDCPNFVDRLIEDGVICPGYETTFRGAFLGLDKGLGRLVCELRVQRGATQIWARLALTLNRCGPAAKYCVVGTFENITQQKEAALNYLSETQFYQAILAEKDAYAEVDVSRNIITRIGGMWNLYNEIIGKLSYAELTESFINKVVHPDDRKHYLELMQPDNFTQSLDNGIDRLSCQFRRIVEQNKMVWMQLGVHLFRDALTGHVQALLHIEDIDEKKKRELLRVGDSQPRSSALEGQDALKKSVAEMGEAFSFHEFIGEQGDIAYLVEPDTFELLSVNKAMCDRLGLTENQCLGMKCYEAMHKRKSPCPFCGRANWSTDKFYLWKNQNDALEQEFLIKNKLVDWQGRQVLLALAVDISNNKNIVDSLENGVTEVQSILGGVQHMSQAPSLTMAMHSALESIGNFFRADAARLWQRGPDGNYVCSHFWARSLKGSCADGGGRAITLWLESRKWDQPVILENPEATLGQSYDMYRYMKSHNVENQRWVQIKENNEEFGCISIDNITSNFRNIAFMESFSVFIASEMKKRSLMEGLVYAHRYDDLTGLLSRKSYEDFVNTYNADNYTRIGVLIMNFNNLKEINSASGFQMGNFCIRRFTSILRELFADYISFRMNGDEFLVIAPEISRTELDSKVAELELRIRKSDAFSVSFGSSWDDVENDLGALIEQATQAMKVNKKRYYDLVPDTSGAERRKMLNELSAALHNGEFEVFLQPKVDMTHGRVVGAEALIRRWDKDLGLILPIQFIGMLEKNNLIRYIDLFVFEEVCKQLEKWKRQGLFVPVVSHNFSRLTLLERDILASMESIISCYDVSKKSLEIEITESVIADMGKSVLYQAACDLYNAGFSISLDDFGTKYTNLAMLAELDFSMLKVDKSLIGKLGVQGNHELIMKNIIEMCRDLGIRVLAEGVETEAQEQILQGLDCHLGQGYLYGKPMPMAEFSRKFIEVPRQD